MDLQLIGKLNVEHNLEFRTKLTTWNFSSRTLKDFFPKNTTKVQIYN